MPRYLPVARVSKCALTYLAVHTPREDPIAFDIALSYSDECESYAIISVLQIVTHSSRSFSRRLATLPQAYAAFQEPLQLAQMSHHPWESRLFIERAQSPRIAPIFHLRSECNGSRFLNFLLELQGHVSPFTMTNSFCINILEEF